MSVQAIGEPVRREEDLRLLTGRGRYVDDAGAPTTARGYVLRSPHAHARILAIDVGRARTAPGRARRPDRRGSAAPRARHPAPGVPRRRRDGTPAFVCPQPLLAQERVRYVGDPVAFVVAETLNQAKDAAELIEIDYEPLPAVITAAAALAPGAPAVWDDNPGNEAFFHEVGNKEAVDAAFARADRVVRDEIRHQPGHRQHDGAARLPRRIRPRPGPLHDPLHGAVGARHPRRARRPDLQAAAAPVPRRLRQYGRRLRHEGRLLSGIRAVAVGVRGRSAARCAGSPSAAKASRPTSRAAAASSRPSWRSTSNGKFLALRTRWQASIGAYYSTDRPTIPLTIGLGLPRQHLYAFRRSTPRSTAVADQHDDDRALSRRQPPRADLRHRDHHRQGGARARARSRPSCAAATRSRRAPCPITTPLQQTYDCGDFARISTMPGAGRL